MLAPSLYEAMLRSQHRLRRFLPGDVGFFTSFKNDIGGTERDLALEPAGVAWVGS